MYSIFAYAFSISLICLLAITWSPLGRLVLDRPNQRSLHAAPVPRTGGIAILAGASFSLMFVELPEQIPLLIALALGGVSFLDDLFNLPSLVRLIAHLAGAAIVLALCPPRPDLPLAMLLLLGIGWITNLFNFMDGSDGLAGGMAVFGFGTYAIAASNAGGNDLSALCLVLTLATLAFLLFNFHPARIFMGDVGSVPLGFLAGTLGFLGWQEGLWPIWFPILVFSPFFVDATLTLLKRVLRREKIWKAHREHYYQKLVRMGFGHRKTALLEYLLMLGIGVLSLEIREAPAEIQAVSLSIIAAIYFGLVIWIDTSWAKFTAESAQK